MWVSQKYTEKFFSKNIFWLTKNAPRLSISKTGAEDWLQKWFLNHNDYTKQKMFFFHKKQKIKKK